MLTLFMKHAIELAHLQNKFCSTAFNGSYELLNQLRSITGNERFLEKKKKKIKKKT